MSGPRSEGPEAIRVLVADDHPVVRQGLRTFLESRDGITVVGEAADSEAAIAAAARLGPDVVVMDLVMPGVGGIAATRRITDAQPETNVLVLTSFAGDDQVVPAVRAGAAGYLLKDADPAELEAAIRAVHRGQRLLDPRAAGALMDQIAGPASTGPRRAALTPREEEVLRLLAHGLTNRQLARELVVSDKTIKTHVSNILAKLGLADRTQAALYAVREGLAAPPDPGLGQSRSPR